MWFIWYVFLPRWWRREFSLYDRWGWYWIMRVYAKPWRKSSCLKFSFSEWYASRFFYVACRVLRKMDLCKYDNSDVSDAVIASNSTGRWGKSDIMKVGYICMYHTLSIPSHEKFVILFTKRNVNVNCFFMLLLSCFALHQTLSRHDILRRARTKIIIVVNYKQLKIPSTA